MASNVDHLTGDAYEELGLTETEFQRDERRVQLGLGLVVGQVYAGSEDQPHQRQALAGSLEVITYAESSRIRGIATLHPDHQGEFQLAVDGQVVVTVAWQFNADGILELTAK